MNKKLIIFIIALIIIIIGITMACKTGFNLGLDYSASTRINIYMQDTSNIQDIEQTVKEVFDGKYEIGYTDEFSDTVSINAKGISEEQISSLKEKLREKYEFSEDMENIVIIDTPRVLLYDMVKEYITPIVITFVLTLVYFGVAFRKLGTFKAIFEPAIIIIIINALYISILAIFKIEINEYIIPLGIFIYVLSLMGNTICLSSKNKKAIAKSNNGGKNNS